MTFRQLFMTVAFAMLMTEASIAQIFVMNLDGVGGIRQIAKPAIDVLTLRLNADDTEFLLGARDNNRIRTFFIKSDGNGLKELTPKSDPDAGAPTYSYDFTRIGFGEYSRRNLYTVDLNWRNKQLLASDGGGLDFSEDGSKLVFVRQVQTGPVFSLVIIAAKSDGSAQQQITGEGTLAWTARFNPSDSGQIVFADLGAKPPGIYTMRVDGSQKKFVVGDINTYDACFTRDGSQIVYIRTQNTSGKFESEIDIVGVDGKNSKKLASGPNVAYTSPSVSHDNKKIIFLGTSTALFDSTLQRFHSGQR